MNIILYGFKRVGKTTFGKEIASILKCPFIDTDHLIIEAYHKKYTEKLKIHEIHEALGEDGFRLIEEEVVSKLNVANAVISVGGGTVLNSNCLHHLKRLGKFIYLIRSKEQTKRALSLGRIPNYLDQANFDSSFEKMYQIREKKYLQIADASLDLTSLTDKEVVAQLLSTIQKGPFFLDN
ncbi:MAG: Shikimate kinase [Chlamydiae bacterium]|nr:Shikimate kinase [Chlamydiota bacterium]